jgi:hypothetical protein
MEVVLNIGLARTGKPNLKTSEVLDTLAREGFRVRTFETFQSDTEPTLVITAIFGLWSTKNAVLGQAVHRAAVALDQDCIGAWLLPSASGALIGPRAAEWGDFNPEFFIMPDGRRLASPAAKAA